MKTPRVVVSAVIRKDDKLLLVKEVLEDGKEYWIFPGGGVEFGETLEDALKREIEEELGIKIQIERFMGFKEAVFPNYGYHTIIFFYLAQPLGELKVKEDKILEAKFFSPAELTSLNLVDSARWVLTSYFTLQV